MHDLLSNATYFINAVGGYGIVIAALGYFVYNFIQTKRTLQKDSSDKIDAEKKDAEAAEKKVVDIYTELNKGQATQIDTLKQQLQDALAQIRDLQKEMGELRKENTELAALNKSLLPYTELMKKHEDFVGDEINKMHVKVDNITSGVEFIKDVIGKDYSREVTTQVSTRIRQPKRHQKSIE